MQKLNINVIGGSGFTVTRLMCRLRSNDPIVIKIIDKATSKAFPDLMTPSDLRSVEQLSQSITHGSVIVNLATEHRDVS